MGKDNGNEELPLFGKRCQFVYQQAISDSERLKDVFAVTC